MRFLLLAALAAPAVTLDGHRLVLPEPIRFTTGAALGAASGAALDPASGAALDGVAEFLAEKSAITLLRIEAHSDGAGDQALTEARSMAVAKALVARGVACGRLLPVGFGANKPTADPSTPEGKAQNRRVELVNAAFRGIAIGGMPVDGGGQVAGDPCRA